ncbi:uncharacterized protein LOC144573737 [Carex rostrata]
MNQGFPLKYIAWIRNAILTGSSQIMINGLLGRKIILKRGVRQGDPLSPLLFILAIDFLARYSQKLANSGAIKLAFEGMSPCLLYADDALFFVKPEIQQLQALQVMLTVFQRLSGLSVNLSKSELVVSNGTEATNQELANVIGCKLGTFPFTYLGLPLSNSRLPKTAFLPLLHRMNKRLAGWAAAHLSIAGRMNLDSTGMLPESPIFTTAIKPAIQFCQCFFTHIPGNGQQIMLWNNNWGNGLLRDDLLNLFSHAINENITLKEAATTPIQSLFRQPLTLEALSEIQTLQQMLHAILLSSDAQDDISWKGTSNGKYTVKSAYLLMKNTPRIQHKVHRVWALKVPPRVKVFGWLMLRNRLLTIDNLHQRGLTIPNRCVLCKSNLETIHHLFNACPYSLALFNKLEMGKPSMIAGKSTFSASRTASILSTRASKEYKTTTLIAQFIIWRERCARTFGEVNKDITELMQEIDMQLHFITK